MSDFEFQIVGDAKAADKAIDGVLDGLDDIRKKAVQAGTSIDSEFAKAERAADDLAAAEKRAAQAMDTIGLGANNNVSALQRMANAAQGWTGKLGSAIGALDKVGKSLGPWNQVMELGGKAVRFLNEGLDAAAKKYPQYADDISALKKEFSGLKDEVLAVAGVMTVELLKPFPSIDALEKRMKDLQQQWMFFLQTGRSSIDLAGIKGSGLDLLGGLEKSFRSLEGAATSALGGVQRGIEATAAAAKKAAEENARWAAEFKAMQAGNQGRNYLDTVSLGPDISGGVAGGIGAPTNYTAGVETGVSLWSDSAAAKTAKWNEEVQKSIELQNQLASGLGAVGAEFVSMAAAGEMSIGKLLDSLAKLALQLAAIKIGGPWGAALGAFAGGLPGFATGGSFNVGGAGGTDSQVVAFRATPGEKVTVQTPQQQGPSGGNGGGTFRLVVSDERNSRRIRRDNDVEIDSSLRRLGVRR